MSKLIKVDDLTYDQLSQLKGQRDTFADVIRRLLANRSMDQNMPQVVDNLVAVLHDVVDGLNNLRNIK